MLIAARRAGIKGANNGFEVLEDGGGDDDERYILQTDSEHGLQRAGRGRSDQGRLRLQVHAGFCLTDSSLSLRQAGLTRVRHFCFGASLPYTLISKVLFFANFAFFA